MKRGNVLIYTVVGGTLALLVWLVPTEADGLPSFWTFAFWIGLLAVAEILPVSLGYRAVVTMGLPVGIAIIMLFNPLTSMLMMGIGSFDIREFRHEITLPYSLYNRAQTMLSAAAASAVIHLYGGDVFAFPDGIPIAVLAAAIHVVTNLGLVSLLVVADQGIPLRQVVGSLVPSPATGFWIAQALLAGLGIATAAAYESIGPFVAAFLIPLLFARISIIGARTQQELAERVRKQQQTLMSATEQVFQEREQERKRIAAEIHDSSLQLLTAASYGVGNAKGFLSNGQSKEAERLLNATSETIEQAIKGLRGSLVDLRRSSVESGGLVETIHVYIDQVSTLWGTKVVLEGSVEHEPPVPVALAAFQILQEGLVNALKHANSKTVRVRINDEDNMVHIVVEDDGSGFDLGAQVASDHVGMRLMKERAALVGGWIDLHSSRGVGTRLEAVLPGGVAT
jgi:signal transduction histidine kinase